MANCICKQCKRNMDCTGEELCEICHAWEELRVEWEKLTGKKRGGNLGDQENNSNDSDRD